MEVTPFVGVWIETQYDVAAKAFTKSHPSWVCGLKQLKLALNNLNRKSHPSWVCGLKLTW